MLLSKLLLLPFAVASTVTVYVQSVPASDNSKSPLPSSTPLAQIDYDESTSTGTLASYTAPVGAYTPDHLLRVGLSDISSGSWSGVVTSAASFAEQYKKKFVIHVDEKGTPYHVGFGTSARGKGKEIEIEIVKRAAGPAPALNKPIVLNADGKIGEKEPEKTFLQKYWWVVGLFVVVQLVAGGGEEK
ncbi:hypothetical protein BU24DRAFT_489633 [Aaosphaeria arxii CBS 175.79]|uniref:Cyclin-dependent protein kinase regulator pho80 n=1 Tax=Aaosphaeria arxii CBS 175.79 TaxID=1450172 RepID=A0A6A5Y3D8_9PLEO|nr:uncharacterized protein BU24DRAFT_489633 [Aaosphaeria arxii CBS 175.79]KAF2019733.1 hypothetical protein BU24DRAFT_489633 [Aaosphaeria arxii CBS 175.79]